MTQNGLGDMFWLVVGFQTCLEPWEDWFVHVCTRLSYTQTCDFSQVLCCSAILQTQKPSLCVMWLSSHLPFPYRTKCLSFTIEIRFPEGSLDVDTISLVPSTAAKSWCLKTPCSIPLLREVQGGFSRWSC